MPGPLFSPLDKFFLLSGSGISLSSRMQHNAMLPNLGNWELGMLAPCPCESYARARGEREIIHLIPVHSGKSLAAHAVRSAALSPIRIMQSHRTQAVSPLLTITTGRKMKAGCCCRRRRRRRKRASVGPRRRRALQRLSPGHPFAKNLHACRRAENQ